MLKAKPRRSWQNVSGVGYMGISLFSKSHDGEGLKAMVDWINEQDFFSFRVGLSDTLNRFNTPVRAAFEACVKAGDEWLERNGDTLDQIEAPHEVIRWSHWLDNHADEVNANKHAFMFAFGSNEGFRTAIKGDMEAFTKRTQKEASLEYLIEELAVYSVMMRQQPATMIYPAKPLRCMDYVRHNPDSFPNGLGNTTHVQLALHNRAA
ncbi:MAG: hypothetical protein AAGB32_00445 [Pseudomonadota bacterium]